MSAQNRDLWGNLGETYAQQSKFNKNKLLLIFGNE